LSSYACVRRNDGLIWTTVDLDVVMRGQKRVEDARERAYNPRIHLLRKKVFTKWMDCRVKPGND